MGKMAKKIFLIVSFAGMTWPATHLGWPAGQQSGAALNKAESSLRRFLQKYVGTPPSDTDKKLRYMQAWIDLNGDGKKEAVVYLSGEGWCGSGGCITLILKSKDASYQVVTGITITRPPIRVLRTRSHGWRNITVWVRGGGILPGYESELQFNGKTYPNNPSVPPARQLRNDPGGEVILPPTPQADMKPLYQ